MVRNRKTNRLNKHRLLSRLFPNGALIGMGVYAVLFLFSLAWSAGFSVMGVQKAEVTRLVATSFWPWILFSQVKILAAYLVIGFVVGWSAEFIGKQFALFTAPFKLVWVLFVHAYLLVSSMHRYPQLYAEAFYFHDAASRSLQLVVTDHLPAYFFSVPGWGIAAVILFAVAMWFARRFGKLLYVPATAMLLVLLVLAASSTIRHRGPANHGPNVLIIAADSFRKDRLGVEGYDRGVTPVIDSLIYEGVLFDKTFTPFPRTFPATISLLNGKLPMHHGVRHMFPSRWVRDHRENALPELLREKGYATAVVSDFAGDVFSRMQIGFERVRVPYFNFITLIDQRSLEVHAMLFPYLTNPYGRKVFPELREFANNADPFMLADETIAELEQLKKKDRFMCMTFFSTLHFPYAAPWPYYQRYTEPSYRGRFKYHKPPTLYGREVITDDDRRQINALYDGAAASFDAAVGRIIDYLKKEKLYDNTLIIVTADHGENLYDNDWSIGHGEHLRGANVLEVPLVMRFPNREYARVSVDELTRITDVYPTVLEYLGMPVPKDIDGQSMMGMVREEKKLPKRTAFAETGIWFSDVAEGFYQEQRIMYPDITGISRIDFTDNLEVVLKDEYEGIVNTAKHRMVDDGRYRLIYIPLRTGVRYELYDTEKDPGFKTDIASRSPEKLQAMKKLLFEYLKKDPDYDLVNGYVVPVNRP